MPSSEPHVAPPLSVDKYSRTPIYEQLIEQFEMHIALGDFSPREPLPSVRSLSTELSVNPNTLQKAYTELERRGLCYTVPGSGRFVSPDASPILRSRRQSLLQDIARETAQLAQTGISLEDILQTVNASYEQAIRGGTP